MAEKQQLSELTTKELTSKLVRHRFLKSYFRRSKTPEFWERAVAEIEEELRKRGALD